MKEMTPTNLMAEQQVFVRPIRLTGTAETPYAKRGTARMNDAVNNAELLTTAPTEQPVSRPVKEKEKDDKIPEKDKQKLQVFKDKVDGIKKVITEKGGIEKLSKEELKSHYQEIHKNLSLVKFFTSPTTFLRALEIASPVENQVRKTLTNQTNRVETEELEALRKGSSLSEEKKARHTHKRISQDALRHIWKQFYTPQELKDEKTQEGIETAVTAGYLPVGEPENEASLDEKAKQDLARQRELIRKAEEVDEHSKIENEEDRKQKAWDVLIKKRHAQDKEFDVTKLADTARQAEINEVIEQQREKAWDELITKRHAEEKEFDVTKLDEGSRQKEITEIIRTRYSEYAGEKEVEQRYLRGVMEEAIIDAHNVGSGDESKGVYNYSLKDISDKYKKLEEVGFKSEDIRELMEAGIVGIPDATNGGGNGEVAGNGASMNEHAQPPSPPGEFGAVEDQEEYFENLRAGRPTGRTGSSEEDEENAEFQEDKLAAQLKAESLRQRITGMTTAEQLRDFLSSPQHLNGNITRIGTMIGQRRKSQVPVEMTVENFRYIFEPRFAEANAALDRGDLEGAKQIANSMVQDLRNQELGYYDSLQQQERTARREGGSRQIQDLHDVVRYIMEASPENWATEEYISINRITDENGELLKPKHPLLHADDSINQANFVRWYRERINYYHGFDPDQPLNFFGEIKIDAPSLFRQLSLNTMYDNYGTYFKDKTGEIHKPLREAALQHAWLIGQARNMDVQYRQNMSDDSKFSELLVGLFKPNTFGKEFEGVNTLAGLFAMDAEFNPEAKIGDGDMRVGDAIRNSYLFYYHMTDEQKLRDLFPNFNTYISRSAFDEAIKAVMKDQKRDPEDKEARAAFEKEAQLGDIQDLFRDKNDPTQMLDSIPAERIGKFLIALNLFDPPTKNRHLINIGRKLVRQMAGEASGLAALKDNSSLDFAELTAYLMTYWTGAASRQDVRFTAINAFTKTDHFQGYLKKQAHNTRAGGIGNPYEFPLLKRITTDPMTGILTTRGKTTLELLEKMQEIRNSGASEDVQKKEMKELLNTWSYGDLSWRQYAPQHVGNGFKEFHDRTSGKEIHIDQFASYDVWGHVVYDHAKMISDVQEGLIKPTRYRWSTHRLPYQEMEREFIGINEKTGEAEYRDSTLSETMFGPQVLLTAAKMQTHEFEKILNGKNEEDKAKLTRWLKDRDMLDARGKIKPFIDENGRYLRMTDGGKEKLSVQALGMIEHTDYRRLVTKAYLVSKFAVQLYSTTELGTGHKRLDYPTRELILATLGHIPAGIEVEDETDFRTTHLTEFYFNDYDLKLMRQMSGNGEWQNFWRAAKWDLLGGGVDGLGGSLKQFFKQIMKI